MAAPDQGLTPATVSDHFMQAAVLELRAAVQLLGEIRDVLAKGTQPKQPDLRSLDTTDQLRVKEPAGRKK